MRKDRANKGFWERAAFLYAPVMERDSSFYQRVCDSIAPHLHADMRVLELACGSGQLTGILADRVCAWEATDFSENMVVSAQKRLDGGKLSFAVRDATKLPYAEGSFDAVVIANALHIMPAPELALREIRRVLKPGGLLFAPTFVYEGRLPKMKLRLMEKIGFRTFHRWSAQELSAFVREYGFDVAGSSIIKGAILPECSLIAGKR